jgi:phosphoglycerate kinase
VLGFLKFQIFATAIRELAEALAASNAKTIIGGGDSVTAVKQFGLAAKMTFISTGEAHLWSFWRERNCPESQPLQIGDWDRKSEGMLVRKLEYEYRNQRRSQRDLGA